MAVYAPGDSPRDDGNDPGMWARLMGYINPVGSAQAAPAPAPAPAPSQPSDPRAAALGQAQQALQSGPGNTNQPPVMPYLGGPGGPNVQGMPILPYFNPNTAALANAASINTDLGGGGSSGGAGATGTWPAPDTPLPPPRPIDVPLPPPRPVTTAPALTARPKKIARQAAAPVRKRIRAPVAAPTADPNRWLIDRPNMDATAPMYSGGRPIAGGPLSRGGPPKMTALDLSGLFRRG